MAKTAGRDLLIKKAGVTIAGARTTGISFSGTPIDDSDQSDAANVSFLASVMGEETMEISVSGVEDGQVLRDLMMSTSEADRHFSDLTIVFANGDVISGNFICTAYSEGGEYRDAGTFDATFVRNGAHTYTPI